MKENENKQDQQDQLVELGADVTAGNQGRIYTLTIIGQVEGHQVAPETVKTTKTDVIGANVRQMLEKNIEMREN